MFFVLPREILKTFKENTLGNLLKNLSFTEGGAEVDGLACL
jgi:hypothetical protein